jgi:hypothetical protein
MDTEQLTEEQRYYKEKYFKYKLKYLTLKEELEGGFLNAFKSKKPAPTAKPTGKPTVVNASEYYGNAVQKRLEDLIQQSTHLKEQISIETMKEKMQKVINKKNPQNNKDYDLSFLDQVKIMLKEFENETITSRHVLSLDLYKYLEDGVIKTHFTVMK